LIKKEVVEVSESEAKQYLLDSIENCRKAISAVEAAGGSGLEAHKKAIEEAIQLLESLQEKVFLKTKKAVGPTFQVKETSEAVADKADELGGGDEDAVQEFKDAVGQIKDHVATLQAQSKTQSVIVT
jgi:hypothetical protein